MLSPHLAYLEYASAYPKPFVTYRLPNENESITLILDKNSANSITNYSEIENRSGFVFTPFDTNQHPSYFITPNEILKGDKGFRADLFSNKETKITPIQLTQNLETRAIYEAQFEKMYALLQENKLQKVILSRTITLPFAKEEHLYTYYNLMTNYPKAMVYWIYLPHLGVEWMGATPELLLSKKEERLHTLALAGTKKAEERWTQKEIEEQQMVMNYISKRLQDHSLQVTPTETLDTGSIQHLATRFTLHNSRANFFDIIKRLHPTPAICGLPKHEAFEAIRTIETHDRNYYCGFLGPINIANTTTTFVNLRCMELTDNTARLYVGGGLTKGSNVEQEWQETERKADTLHHFLS